MPRRTSGGDPSERNAEAEARSAGCTVDLGTVNRRPLPEIWMPSTEERDLRTLLRRAPVSRFVQAGKPCLKKREGETAHATSYV